MPIDAAARRKEVSVSRPTVEWGARQSAGHDPPRAIIHQRMACDNVFHTVKSSHTQPITPTSNALSVAWMQWVQPGTGVTRFSSKLLLT
jgi:hypothetical protein